MSSSAAQKPARKPAPHRMILRKPAQALRRSPLSEGEFSRIRKIFAFKRRISFQKMRYLKNVFLALNAK